MEVVRWILIELFLSTILFWLDRTRPFRGVQTDDPLGFHIQDAMRMNNIAIYELQKQQN